MSFEDAAAIPINYLTAYFTVFHCANLGHRKSILIHMAAGGVVSLKQEILNGLKAQFFPCFRLF